MQFSLYNQIIFAETWKHHFVRHLKILRVFNENELLSFSTFSLLPFRVLRYNGLRYREQIIKKDLVLL